MSATAVSLNLDKTKLHAAATALKSEKADVLNSLSADPKAFLARFGVGIDDGTAHAIKRRVAGKNQAAPASVVHIDV
jgi:hypothetical protein